MTDTTLAAARVLVVDDDQLNRDLLRRLLTQLGVGEVRVEAGADGLTELVLAYDPHLILLDLHLRGGVDGLDAIAELAATDPNWAGRRVVVVSGDLDAAVLPRATAAGVAEVLGKPYTAERLRDTVRRALEPAGGSAATMPATAGGEARDAVRAHLAHEVRTPLTTIIGFAELLATADLSDEHLEWTAALLRAARHLKDVLDEVLPADSL